MFNQKKIASLLLLAIFMLNFADATNNNQKSNVTINPQIQLVKVNTNNNQYSNFQDLASQTNDPYSFQGQNSGSSMSNIGIGNGQFKTSSASGIIFQQNVNDSSWYNDDWSYRKNITVLASAFQDSETNFPLLLDIKDKDLKLALNSGYDILFTDANNNKLDYERTAFDKYYSSTEAHLTVWVKSDYSNVTNTILMMYFGNPFSSDQQNPKGTWSNGYAAVYHLNSVGPTIVDSTGNYNGSTTMTSSASRTGIVGNGIYFSGTTTDKILLGNINSDSWSALSIEAFVNRSNLLKTKIITKETSTVTVWSIETNYQGNPKLVTNTNTDGTNGILTTNTQNNVIKNTNTWYFLGLTWDSVSGNQITYIDTTPSSKAAPGDSILNSTATVSIGASPDGTNPFTGLIDEVRISKVARSANWLADSRSNELNPNNFYTVNSTYEQLKLEGDWAFNQLNYRKPITIPQTALSQNLTNYPFLINIIDGDLHSRAQSSGNDILFTDANGLRLEFETERFNYYYDSTHSNLVAWVNVPTVSNVANTTIYMYYGNTSVVRYDKSFKLWNTQNYTAVWHLGEPVLDEGTASNAHVDSTGNGYYGNQSGNLGSLGVIGYGQIFDGNDKISIKNSSLGGQATTGIITGWFKVQNEFNSTSTNSQVLMSKYQDASNNAYIALIGTDKVTSGVNNGSLTFKVEQSGLSSYAYTNRNNWTANSWYQYVIVYDSNSPSTNKIYINGIDNTATSHLGTCTSCSMSFSSSWTIGGGMVEGTTSYLNGSMDELRFSTTIPLNAEINYTYQQELNLLYIVGNQKYFDFLPPKVINYDIEDHGMGVATFWVQLYDKIGVDKAWIVINKTDIHQASYNGSMYTFSMTPVFGYNYNFTLLNATDLQGLVTYGNGSYVNHTFNIDNTNPIISDWFYDSNAGSNGTFYAQVSDIWAGISSVQVQVQNVSYCSYPCSAFMQYNNNSGYYETSNIYMIRQTMTFNITAIDLGGNVITSPTRSGKVNDRNPVISDVYLYNTTNDFYSNQSLMLHYSFTDPEGDPDTTIIYWYNNSVLVPSFTNMTVIPVSAIKKHQNWYASLLAYDSYSYGNIINTSIITIKDTPPTVTASLIQVDSQTNLSAQFLSSYYDYDGDLLANYTIQWYRDNLNGSGFLLIPAFNNKTTISYLNTNKNELWYFTVVVFDSEFNSNVATSPIITIQNTLPKASNLGFNATNYTVSETVNISYSYSDFDGDTQNTTYGPIVYWYINNVYQPNLDNQTIINATDPNRINDAYYRFVIRVYDGYNYSANYTSQQVLVGYYLDQAPIISGLYFYNSTIVCTNNQCTSQDYLLIQYNYTDPDSNDTTGFGNLYYWYKDDVHQPQYDGLDKLPVGALQHGDVWRVNVTPSDGIRYGNWSWSPNITIYDILPIVTFNSIYIQYSNGTTSTVTTATTNFNLYANFTVIDPDNDTLTAYILWSNGTNNYNLTSLPNSYTVKGQTWNVTIQYYDGYNWSVLVFKQITIVNAKPVISGLVITGGENISQQISLNYAFNDYDSDPDQSNITWYINGVPYATNNKILIYSIKAGDVIYAVINSYDGSANGNSLITLTIIVGNGIPIAGSVYIYHTTNQTSNFYVNGSLEVNFTATDIDGFGGSYGLYTVGSGYYIATVGVDYKWYLNESSTGFTSSSIPTQYLHKGDRWIVSIRIRDRNGAVSQWLNSTEIVILNAPTLISTIMWNSNNPTSNTNLQISFSTLDIDNDNKTITIRWYVNNTEITSNLNQYSLNSYYFSKNEIILVNVTVFDGTNFTYQISSVSIKNSLPVVNSISINNNTPLYTNDSLVLEISYFDPDNDPQVNKTIVYWFMNDNPMTDYTNFTTIDLSHTQKGERWYAIIQVYDGQDYSIAYDSRLYGSYVILNSPPIPQSYSINSYIGPKDVYTNVSLTLQVIPFDYDGDITVYYVKWYINGTYDSFFDNKSMIDLSYTHKGQVWRAEFEIYDGTNFSIWYTSYAVTIVNSPPYTLNFSYVFSNPNVGGSQTRYFYLDTENIVLINDYYDTDGDQNASTILWYKNGYLQPDLNDSFIISSDQLHQGDYWWAVLKLSDGEITLPERLTPTIWIEAVPDELSNGYRVPTPSTNPPDGIYNVYINLNQTGTNVTSIDFYLDPSNQNNTAVASLIAKMSTRTITTYSSPNETWVSDKPFELFSTNRSAFSDYLGKTIIFTAIVHFTVEDPTTHEIYTIVVKYLIPVILKDETAPTVESVSLNFDNEISPQNVTFTATIVDYGSGIKNVTLYYYYETYTPSSQTPTITAKLMADFNYSNSIPMQFIQGNEYAVNVPFYANQSIRILYRIEVFDNANNGNPNAFPDGLIASKATVFTYSPPGLTPEVVA